MNAIFMNSKNSKISYPYKWSLNVTTKIDLQKDGSVTLHYQP